MTTTMSKMGRAIYFPPRGPDRQAIDADLVAIACDVHPDAIHVFVRRLVNAAQKRRFNPTAAEMNIARLKLARHCLDRLVAAGGLT